MNDIQDQKLWTDRWGRAGWVETGTTPRRAVQAEYESGDWGPGILEKHKEHVADFVLVSMIFYSTTLPNSFVCGTDGQGGVYQCYHVCRYMHYNIAYGSDEQCLAASRLHSVGRWFDDYRDALRYYEELVSEAKNAWRRFQRDRQRQK